jgi:thioredoxin-dependent peroxiredoxin
MLAPGTEAPDFELTAHDGSTVRLRNLRGRWVLVWWYPKAATPG